MDAVTVRHDSAAQRFSVDIGGRSAYTHYQRGEGRIVFTHTEVPEAFVGHGIGSQLAKAALEYARAERLAVVPRCPFIAGYISRHPEYQKLVASDLH